MFGLRMVAHIYQLAVHKNADPRTANWFLMSSPLPILCTLLSYVLFVKFGKKIMLSRRKFEIQTVLVFYNAFLVVLSIYMFFEFVISLWGIPNFNYYCQGVEIEDRPDLVRHARVNWLFFISKIVEFSDSVFLILTKKPVSFLHVYHHVSACSLWWIIVKWIPGGTTYFGALLNCFVHAVMYSYYLLSSLGPVYRKYLWWKKYLTSLQLLQFSLVFVYLLNATRMKDCNYPRWFLWMLIGYDVTLILLFINFFIQEYILKSVRKGSASLKSK